MPLHVHALPPDGTVRATSRLPSAAYAVPFQPGLLLVSIPRVLAAIARVLGVAFAILFAIVAGRFFGASSCSRLRHRCKRQRIQKIRERRRRFVGPTATFFRA
jgi:hypothetical protein